MKFKGLILLVLIIKLYSILNGSVMVSGAGLASAAWPKHLYDQQNTGCSPYAGPETPNIRWTYIPVTGDMIYYGSVAIGEDGTIYVITKIKGKLSALSPADGIEIWTTEIGESWSSPVLSADGIIYLPTRNSVVAIYSKDGTIKWRFTDITKPTDRLTVNIGNDGTIYFGADDGNLYALNSDGSLKWKIHLSERVLRDTPAIGHDGTIYIGCYDGKLYAVTPEGKVKWSFTTGKSIHCAPAVAKDGTIYVGSQDTTLYAINPDGTQKWAFETWAAIIVSSPAIGPDGTIYIGSTDTNLYAVHPNGTLKWSFSTGNRIFSSPIVDKNGVIYIATIDTGSKLYAVNSDGSKKWELNITDTHNCPAIAADGTLYIGNYWRGTLYAIGEVSD